MYNQEIYHSDKMRLINWTSCSLMKNWKFKLQTYDFDKNNQKMASQLDYNLYVHETHQNSIWPKFPLYIHLISN